MKLPKVGAVALFFQGITPALVFGFWRPGGILLLAVAAIYALLAWGIWASKRWALILAIIFTVPQLFIVSSKLFSWQLFIGGAFGPGVAPSSSFLNTRFTSFYSVGAGFNFAISERSQSLLSAFTFIGSETFILLNAVAVLVLTMLTAIFVRCRSEAEKLPSEGVAESDKHEIPV